MSNLTQAATLLQQAVAWFVKKRDEERNGVVPARWTWGTVTATSPLTVTLDNETDQTPVTALGWTPPVGRRVVAVIAGGRVWALAAPVRDDLAPTYAHASLSADYVIANTATTDIGLSVTVTVPGASSVYRVDGTFDFASNSSTAACIGIGVLNVDGTDQPEQVLASNDPASTGFRATHSRSWVIAGLSAGSHTFALRVGCSGTTSALNVRSPHTAITVAQA